MHDSRRTKVRRARLPLLTIPEAEAIIGGSLGHPSKMPCPAWGIAAAHCKRGAGLAKKPGSVCASCYAQRGHYLASSVATAHQRRREALSHPLWPDAMAFLIDSHVRGGHFRWFDSGDLQSLDHLDMVLWIARKTPTVAHWLPTHELHVAAKRVGAVPLNLTLRVSADMIGAMPRETFGFPSSTVHREPGKPVRSRSFRRGDSIECLAYLRGHRCGSCRACWSSNVRNVSYLLNAGLRFLSRDTKRVHLTVLA